MNKAKVRSVINDYSYFIREAGISPEELMDRCPENDEEAMAHIASMFRQMEDFLKEERMGKAFRWLGFIQGALWRSGIYTINDLREHNR